jgi:hypothetical protein
MVIMYFAGKICARKEVKRELTAQHFCRKTVENNITPIKGVSVI